MDMKRWLTAALAFVMTFSQIPASMLSASAEEVGTQIEAPVEEAGAIDLEGMTVEVLDWSEEEDIVEAPIPDNAAAPDTGYARYAKITVKRAALRETIDDQDFAKLARGGTVLVLSTEGEWAKVAFNTGDGQVTAYTELENLTFLDDAEISAFMDAVAMSDDVALYGNSLDTPLETLKCLDPADEGEEDEAEEAIQVESEAQEAMDAAAGFGLSATTLQVALGEARTLTASDNNGKAIATSQLSFSSSNTAVATVNASGLVTAVKSGSATITVTYNKQSLTCAVTVPQEPSSIKLSSTSGTIGVKESYSGLEVIFNPAGTASAITWSTSNAKVATVDATGKITGLKSGSATITARTRNGKKATCRIKVKKAPTKLTLKPTSMTLPFGGATEKLTVKLATGTACTQIFYSSSNTKVATVDGSGVVTSVEGGTATITASTYNGVKATCTVKVMGAPASVRFSAESMSVGTGLTMDPGAGVYDKNGNPTEAALTYSIDAASANPKCISVNKTTGEVKGLSSGSAILRATAANGVTGTCLISVVAVPTDIKLNETSGTIAVKETYTGLRAILVPPKGEETCSAEVTWTSSKPKVVAVDAKTGAITGLKTGSSTITAKTSNGKKATCKVSVKKAPTSLSISPATLKIGAGGMTQLLSLTFSKKSAIGSVSFTSSNPKVASVDDQGVVTTGTEGTTTITATLFNGLSAKCAVTVLGAPARVTMAQTAIAVGIGDKSSVSADAFTASGNEAAADITYFIDSSSPDPDCIKLNADTGAITASKKGVAYVSAKTHNGIVAATPCTVTVTAKPKSLSLPSKITMGVGGTLAGLEAVLVLQDGDTVPASGLTWSSSKKTVVKVDASTGMLTALKKGTATITAKTSSGLKDTCKVTVSAAPTKLALSPARVKLSAGGMTFQLKPTITGGSADVTYTSSNTSVATVSNSGLITTVNPGSATITGKTFNGLTATCAVTVTSMPYMASFDKTAFTLGTDESVTPEVNVVDANGKAAAADLTFRVLTGAQYINLNTSTGEITAKAAGTSVVQVTTHNGVTSTNNCTITIVAIPTAVKVSTTSASMGVDERRTLTAKVTAPKGADTTLTWTSSDNDVVSVSSKGVLTAHAKGTATITAETTNGLTSSCKVTVYKAPTSITISPTSGSIYVDESGRYKVTLSSGSAGYVSFESSDPDIAEIDDEGIATGIAVGKVTITATTYNGKTATAKLTVKKRSSSLPSYDDDDDGDDDNPGGYGDNDTIEEVIAYAESQLGKPYKSKGGYKDSNPSGFDCSGLVYWCYYQVGIKLKDSAAGQGADNTYEKISDIDDLVRGDVVCFKSDGSSSTTTTHTGIYLGGGEFIHASSAAKEVIITEISKDYYTRNFLWGRRIID